MTDECSKRLADEAAEIDADVEAVDPDAVAALDDEIATEHEGPSPERFDGFVRDVDTGRVVPVERTEEDVPIDASMDELFAER